MKSYLSLVSISSKQHKRQNTMTILCITFAVFLITAIFSMADMAIRMETNNRINKDGNWHIMLKNIDKSTAENILARKNIAASTPYACINFNLKSNYTIAGKKTAIVGISESADEILPGFKKAIDLSDNKVVVTENIQDSLHINSGDKIKLKLPNTQSLTFEISSFNTDTSNPRNYDALILFVNMDIFKQICTGNQEDAEISYFVKFQKHTNFEKEISDIKTKYQLSDDNIGKNTGLLMMSGHSDNSYILGLYGVAAVLAALIMMAGVFMIAGSLNSNVAQRTNFFGMLRCLGAEKGQIMKLVKLEALTWCKNAIPIGVLLGIIVTWGLCAFLKFYVGSEFEALPQLGVSTIGILSGFVIGTITVLFAASSPAKKAAKVSPMMAVSQNIGISPYHSSHSKNFYGKVDIALGRYHATASKKNLFLMTSSFALSIILFLSFSVMLSWVNMALNPLKPYAPDCSIYDGDNGLDCSLVSKIEKHPSVKKAFGRMYAKLPAVFERKHSKIHLISYEDYQFEWAKDDLASGRLPSQTGEVLTVFDKSNSLQVGDIIKLNNNTLQVVGVLDDSPFDADEFPTVICSEQSFRSLVGKAKYAIIDIQFQKKATDTDIKALRNLAKEQAGEQVSFSDRRQSNQSVENTYWAFTLFVYSFLAIIALITVLNIVNSISLSVCARMKQYGIMRAVGMETKQVTRMITAETISYGIIGLLVGCLIGIPLHRLLFRFMITNYWGTSWQLPWGSLTVIAVIIVLAIAAAIYRPAKWIRNMSITDAIDEL